MSEIQADEETECPHCFGVHEVCQKAGDLILVGHEMLEALRAVVGPYEGYEDVPIYVRKARAAIAKADRVSGQ